jgi:plastocyanin
MRKLPALIAACTLSLAAPAGAGGDERPGAFALPQAKVTGYATPVIVVERGEEVTFTNLDLEKHDVVQDVETDGFGSKKRMPWCKKKKADAHGHHHASDCPIFWSKLTGLGDTTPILGLQNVKSGEVYSFFCTLHHGMKGKLIVR